jgi:hypothetical protein
MFVLMLQSYIYFIPKTNFFKNNDYPKRNK